MKHSTNKLTTLLAAITTVCLILAAATGTYAWFVGTIGSSSDTLLIYSGDMHLNVGVYRGIDINQDGVLDNAVDAEGNPVRPAATTDPVSGETLAKSPRADVTGYMYSAIDKLEGASYEEYIEGSSILLKIIVENPSANSASADVSIRFSDLGSYFFGNSLASSAQTALNAVMDANSARIMFKLNAVTARAYSTGTGTANMTTGYNTLIRSSDASEVGETVTAVQSVNNYGKTDFYLCEISSGEYFVEGVRLNPGELLELDFKLTCLSTDEIYTSYSGYWDDYLTAHPELTEQTNAENPTLTQADYVQQMYLKELAYIVSDETDNVLSLEFSIDKIYVFGTQVEGGNA